MGTLKQWLTIEQSFLKNLKKSEIGASLFKYIFFNVLTFDYNVMRHFTAQHSCTHTSYSDLQSQFTRGR